MISEFECTTSHRPPPTNSSFSRKLEFAAQYDATKIAVINIKDLDGVKNAINVITGDGAKIFQCISPTTKSEWIDSFEIALKFNQTKQKKAQASKPTSPAKRVEEKSSSRASYASDATLSPTSNSGEVESLDENWGPDWLLSAAEEIQALVAQRHFEEALGLIVKCQEFFVKDSTFFNSSEVIEKVSWFGNPRP